MTLTGLHILLTYKCTYECDHCFVWGSPWQEGTLTAQQLEDILQQARDAGTIKQIFFEGGEPFLYYQLLVFGVKRAKELGFSTGIVTNGYWATTKEDALLWLRPLKEAGLGLLQISSDLLHGDEYSTIEDHPGILAGQELGISSSTISLEPPTGYRDPGQFQAGEPVTSGDIMFRGRAAEKLTEGMPCIDWRRLDTCPYEDLTNPTRVHLDPLGNLHLCQGIVMGNLFQRPLETILEKYEAADMPIVKELVAGGPARLAEVCAVDHEGEYVDACHLCYSVREAVRVEFPEILTPDQAYGVS